MSKPDKDHKAPEKGHDKHKNNGNIAQAKSIYTLDTPGGSFSSENEPKDSVSSAGVAFRKVGHSFLSSLVERSRWPRRATILAFTLITVFAISLTLLWKIDNKLVYRQLAGEVAVEDAVASRSLTYPSKILTDAAKDRAVKDPANSVYKRDEAIVSKQAEALNNLLQAIDSSKANKLLGGAGFRLNPQVIAAKLSETDLTAISNMSSTDWNTVSVEARNSFNTVMSKNIRPDRFEQEIAALNTEVNTPVNLPPTFSILSLDNRRLIVSLIKPFITVNSTFDLAATQVKQADARKNTEDVLQNITKGQILIRKGDVITPLQVEMLERLGLRNDFSDEGSVFGTVGIVTILILLVSYYFGQLFPQAWTNRRILAFLALSIILAAVAIRLVVYSTERTLYPYLLPMAALAMVVASLLDVYLAVLLTALISMLVGLEASSPEMTLVFFAGGVAGALTLWKAERSYAFAVGAIFVAIVQTIVGICYSLILGSLDATSFGLLILFNLINGIVSASLAFFCFSVLGRVFGVTSAMGLLELAHPSQPLMRRLMREAPGTYHHSMLVGTLAEQAAERLAADSMLARVGAYYHDIGKLERPTYFIDNQGSGPNIHDTLDPRESVKFIRRHVEFGVQLAHEHHLPNKVIDIIHQHHGTCLVSFFYQKALRMGLDVNEIEFRYPGPKPQTRIAALVMLADGSEAAVRANVQSGRILTGQTPTVQIINPANLTNGGIKHITITEVVNKIVDDRMKDGQLDECDLTMRDIDQIRKVFVEILTSIYHPRVDYIEHTEKKPTPSEGKVVTGSAVEIPNEVRNLPAADGGSPESSTQPALKAADTEKNDPPEPPSDVGNNNKPRTSGIGGAGQRIE